MIERGPKNTFTGVHNILKISINHKALLEKGDMKRTKINKNRIFISKTLEMNGFVAYLDCTFHSISEIFVS